MTKPLTKPTLSELSEGILVLTKLGETEDGAIIVGPRGWEIVRELRRRLIAATVKGGGDGDAA